MVFSVNGPKEKKHRTESSLRRLGRASTSNSKSRDPLLDGMFSQLFQGQSAASPIISCQILRQFSEVPCDRPHPLPPAQGAVIFFRNFHSNNPKDPKRFGRWGLHLPHPHPSQLKLMWRCKPKDLGGPQVAHPNPTTLAERRYCMAWYGSGRNIL